MKTKINWGIISTGAIAHALARGIRLSSTGRLFAVASREQAKAEAFADEHKIQNCYGSYETLLADPQVDAVYVATPHPQHARWAILAAEAKKHLLIEKPMGVNHTEVMAMIEAADMNGVFLMEAFMYRCHPQTRRLVELIRSRAIGDVRIIHATFGYHSTFNPESRIFANDYAGGGIMDVGCYAVSMSRLIAGAATTGDNCADPIDVKAVGHLGATGVDEWTVASLRFPGDIVAQLSTSVTVRQENIVRIIGTDGVIELENPWLANRRAAEQGKIVMHRQNGMVRDEIRVDAPGTSFQMEADVVGEAILAGAKQTAFPAMSWSDSLGQARTLDRWRESIGLIYEIEKPAKFSTTTLSGRPLRKSRGAQMKYGNIDGLEKPVSRLVMGVDNQTNLPHAAAMFDDFFERGGNAFDTAWVYGNGLQERLLGAWMKSRGVRDRCVVIVKGAHTPYCTPKDLTRQLMESLDRLQTDHADIYLMHRDNTNIPAAEFVDCLAEHQRAGLIRAFGGSNWTIERAREAQARGPFSVLSNNFSLARMVDPIWSGCVSASDPDSRAWLAKTQTTLLAWSSQARGFFVPGNAHPDKRTDEELVRCWYSDDNFQRLARATELAKQKNVSPINIALAYVLHQPFPTFALIGPRLLGETRSSFAGLDVTLTGEELKWLNLES